MQDAKVLKYFKDKNNKKSIISVTLTDWCTFMVLLSFQLKSSLLRMRFMWLEKHRLREYFN